MNDFNRYFGHFKDCNRQIDFNHCINDPVMIYLKRRHDIIIYSCQLGPKKFY